MLQPQYNQSRLLWDLKSGMKDDRYEAYWAGRNPHFIPKQFFEHPRVNLEIGAGTGAFFTGLATLYPDRFYVAVERFRMRARRLVRKTSKSGLANLAGFRGNAIPAILHGVPSESVERIYILYPCPFPKTSQRKHRWYIHPVMPHFVRVLKPGGLMIWASDQKFYIDEARFVCESQHPFKVLTHGELSKNPYNDLEHFPRGRTKFESAFLASGQPCYELVVEKKNPLCPDL